MFGDIGHGTIMAIFGLYMLIKEKAIIAAKSKNEVHFVEFHDNVFEEMK